MGGKKTEIVHFDIEDGRSIDLPVALVTGDSEGPDAVITAGIHGGEYGGIFAAIRLFRELSPSDIKGSVKFITVCDTAAFETRGSHLTADGANLNRCFPGRPGGGYAQSLAAKILDEIKGADYHIDLHSTSPLCISAPLSTYHRGRSGALNDGSHEIAYYYGIPNIVITETEGRWQDKGTCYASVYENIGIPSALVQTGTATASENVRRHLAGLMNVLRRFGTLKGATAPVGRPQIYESMEWIYAKRSGLYSAVAAVLLRHAGGKNPLPDKRPPALPGGQLRRRQEQLRRHGRRDEIGTDRNAKKRRPPRDRGTPYFCARAARLM